MRNCMKHTLALLLALALLLSGSVAAFAQTPTQAHDAALDYLVKNVPAPTVNQVGGEWAILAMARGGADVTGTYYDGYISRIKQTLSNNNGVLPSSTNKKTEYSRVVIALSALGEDVTAFGGHNLLEPLANMEDVVAQGINGAIYALIAFDTCRWDIPTIADTQQQVTRPKLVNYILSRELDSGGFARVGETAEVDITAMALQALARYQSDDDVSQVIEDALTALSDVQAPNGGFYYDEEGETSESAAQVVTALAMLGIDATTDTRFVKAGGNPVTALLKFQRTNGSFYHVAAGTGNVQMATEQAAYALVAYERMKGEKPSLYDMSDVTPRAQLNAAKTTKIAAINAVTVGLNKNDYTADSWAVLQSAISDAISAVNGANTIEAVNSVAPPTTTMLVPRPPTTLEKWEAKLPGWLSGMASLPGFFKWVIIILFFGWVWFI